MKHVITGDAGNPQLVSYTDSGIRIPKRGEPVPKFKDYLEAASEVFGIKPRAIVAKGNARKGSLARTAIAYHLRTRNKMAFPAIGRLLGGRDHSTIIQSYHTVDEKVKKYPGFEHQINMVYDLASDSNGKLLRTEKAIHETCNRIVKEVETLRNTLLKDLYNRG